MLTGFFLFVCLFVCLFLFFCFFAFFPFFPPLGGTWFGMQVVIVLVEHGGVYRLVGPDMA